MIEDFAELIPVSQKNRSGEAFYSGRQAFEKPSDVYILGLNPGGDPAKYPEETVANHTDAILRNLPSNWSAYRDEAWAEGRTAPGTAPIQQSLLYLFKRLGIDAGEVPASNLIFMRSGSRDALKKYGGVSKLARECWPFHQAVIDELGVRLVVHFGLTDRNFVFKQLNARRPRECFATNHRRLSVTCKNSDRLTVVSLVHPSPKRGYPWIDRKVEDDPTESVVRALE